MIKLLWVRHPGILAAEYSAAAVGIEGQVRAILRRHGLLLQTAVKAKASGRPGPNAPTGDYRRSIGYAEHPLPGGGHRVIVGTNRPQGRRLELGFHGTDSLGRTYNQPPYPHFGPALDQIRPGLIADLDRATHRLIPPGGPRR